MSKSNVSFGTHQPHDEVAEYKYKGEVLFTANRKHINEANTKYTISLNKDKTRSWHFLVSGDCFYKWETENKEPHAVDMIIYKAQNESGEWVAKAVYRPTIIN